ncbi:hypothetical protein [Sphingobium sp. YR768]|uniref:hypothetical protein n=1 Tax=Sphingobium sp. YR768 TaxID=1884365 RepID=UPI0008AA91B6|nr:hypothetical protein [Sphingobium sp. YR768]SEQ70833.1 hypothetical protein SAMN05518866_102208 [Sphingobium sp. YR768]
MRRRLALLIATPLLALAGTASAKSTDRCSPATAKPTDIETIQSQYRDWAGQCVRVRGIGVDRHVYADRQALTEQTPPFGAGARRSILLLPNRETSRRQIQQPATLEVTGRVGSCQDAHDAVAEMQAAAQNDFIMVSGYCHTSLATYISPSHIRVIDPTRPMRLTEAEVPPEQRDIMDAPTDWPALPAMRDAAHALFNALAQRDQNAFVRLSEPYYDSPPWAKEARQNFARLTARKAAFAHVPPDTQQERTFTERLTPEEGTPSDLLLCRCKTSDCTGKWPALRRDADNLPERPYLCVAANNYLLGPGKATVIQATAPLAKDGFAEPSTP